MTVPASLIAGDTWEWSDDFADHPAPTWVVTYYFEMLGSAFNVAAAADGASHTATIAAATTAAYKAGRYNWFARAASAGVSKTVAQGVLVVEIDPAAAGTADRRSWARRTLDAVEAFLEGNATSAQKSMQIRDRSIERWSLAELTQLRKELRREVSTQEQAGNAGLGRNIKVRLNRV